VKPIHRVRILASADIAGWYVGLPPCSIWWTLCMAANAGVT
jgi:hypothetical protein